MFLLVIWSARSGFVNKVYLSNSSFDRMEMKIPTRLSPKILPSWRILMSHFSVCKIKVAIRQTATNIVRTLNNRLRCVNLFYLLRIMYLISLLLKFCNSNLDLFDMHRRIQNK